LGRGSHAGGVGPGSGRASRGFFVRCYPGVNPQNLRTSESINLRDRAAQIAAICSNSDVDLAMAEQHVLVGSVIASIDDALKAYRSTQRAVVTKQNEREPAVYEKRSLAWLPHTPGP
jgi:hypothetical protein